MSGKRYRVEESTLIAEYNNGYPEQDSEYCCERLYVTPKGNWFLIGEGGWKSKYAKQVANMILPTKDNLTELTRREAQKFCEAHADVDILEKYFADKIVDA